MKIVVDVPDEEYESYALAITFGMGSTAIKRILNGTPLPKGHGRLIDADALEYTCNSDECGMLTGCNNCQYHIITEWELDRAKTIIEADKEGAEK